MNALAIDVPYDLFWHLTPKKLSYFFKAHELKMEEQDTFDWRLGMYINNAVAVAVEHNLAGKKAKSKYLEKPLHAMKNPEEMTQEELDRQAEMMFTMLNVQKANWELDHPKSVETLESE